MTYYGKDADDFRIGMDVEIAMTTSKAGNTYIKEMRKIAKETAEVNHISVGEKSDKELLCMLACNAANNAVKTQDFEHHFDIIFDKVRKAVGI